MHLLQQIAFIALAAVSTVFFARKAGQIRRNILLGREEYLNDNPGLRWRNLLLLAFDGRVEGQGAANGDAKSVRTC